jgi:Protein of unknown function (DUF1461)
MGRVMDRLRWPLLLVSALFTALFIAWQALSAVDFLYPFWHKALDIDDTVRVYGPQNRNRHGFEYTDAAEHARLFAAIVHAVENRGRGLENLHYRDGDGRPIGLLLTEPEIVHLKDVARLVGAFRIFGWSCSLIFIGVGVSLRLKPAPRPAVKKYLAYSAVIAALGIGAVLVIGPKAVFYKLHTWIFPAGHQWFFYYQESLMTTLMKAPELFAGIAAEWLMLTLVVFVPLTALCISMLPGRPSHP